MPHRVSISAATLPTPPMPTTATCGGGVEGGDGALACGGWQRNTGAPAAAAPAAPAAAAPAARGCAAAAPAPAAACSGAQHPATVAPPGCTHRLVADGLVVLDNAHALQRHQPAVRVAVHHLGGEQGCSRIGVGQRCRKIGVGQGWGRARCVRLPRGEAQVHWQAESCSQATPQECRGWGVPSHNAHLAAHLVNLAACSRGLHGVNGRGAGVWGQPPLEASPDMQGAEQGSAVQRCAGRSILKAGHGTATQVGSHHAPRCCPPAPWLQPFQ